ncbi:hypothetical protein E2C01_086456 [Portunus trituberculatus]|uniref:Uncharacterized protein n=1 Tax=Portunus trituberculatus TaxID=210409 RepID=A0A5B7J3V8_PORTR|nr:hypothetical protein [Portunus trituberculatus]
MCEAEDSTTAGDQTQPAHAQPITLKGLRVCEAPDAPAYPPLPLTPCLRSLCQLPTPISPFIPLPDTTLRDEGQPELPLLLCRPDVEPSIGRNFMGRCGTVEPCALWDPRGLQAHGFKSCPRSECKLGFLTWGKSFLAGQLSDAKDCPLVPTTPSLRSGPSTPGQSLPNITEAGILLVVCCLLN